MSRKSILLISLLIISPVIAYLLWPSDESRIKKLFRDGSRAVEEEKIEDVMAKVSFSYADEHGMSYMLIKNGMERVFRQMSGLRVEYEMGEIEVRDRNATVDLDIRVIATSGTDTGYFMGDAARPARVRFFLEKEGTRWFVSRTGGLPVGF